ncbi:MAG TPA: SMC-Scp complex subunit ScpB, partial [Patescibacteria group bacterium]|nr:SMC-Scp complex subunit ScpB [Patescibacteria group bacterium]
IIAYRGPIARHAIEAIRGVNCSFTLRALLLRGLIERTNNPSDSRSILYRVSFDFLKTLGVDQVEKLSEYDALSKDDRVDSIISQTQLIHQ